jgi:hypothetical protein
MFVPTPGGVPLHMGAAREGVEDMSDSTVYTIGTALSRAQDQGLMVQVLVEGQWLAGEVSATDGHGLVLRTGTHEQAVVRMQSITAVRISSADRAPSQQPPAPRGPGPGQPAYAGQASHAHEARPATTVQPMPGPRPSPAVSTPVLAISGAAR